MISMTCKTAKCGYVSQKALISVLISMAEPALLALGTSLYFKKEYTNKTVGDPFYTPSVYTHCSSPDSPPCSETLAWCAACVTNSQSVHCGDERGVGGQSCKHKRAKAHSSERRCHWLLYLKEMRRAEEGGTGRESRRESEEREREKEGGSYFPWTPLIHTHTHTWTSTIAMLWKAYPESSALRTSFPRDCFLHVLLLALLWPCLKGSLLGRSVFA